VAPSILPDLVLINTQQLWQLVDVGLASPLDPAEQPALTGYCPFAWNAVAYRDRSYGFPYAAEIIQQVYNPETAFTPPTTWTEALAGTGPWRYPAAGGGLFDNATVLLQYAGAGGVLMEDGSVSDPDALAAVFRFLMSARNQEVIPADVVEAATFDETWAAYLALPTGMASVDSSNFLAQGGVTPTSRFAPIPTQNGQSLTVANTWALAILTSEEAKRRDALELVAALLDPEVQGAWSQFANVLPTTQAALAQWTSPDDYTAFLDVQLNAAIALPNGSAFASFATEVVQAQIGVLTGNLTPAEATAAVTGQEQ
jgi:ABC-type glycerol-3-phosphate transport system substrate-binding protein